MISPALCCFRKAVATTIIILTAVSLFAGEITCATWNMEWFPSGVANRRMPDIEPARIKMAGDAIGNASPSILFVQEVRDKETCDRLATASGISGLKVAVCSEFEDQAGIPIFQQCAILTSYPVVEAAAERWHSYGVVDPPRGYAYALLDTGGGRLVACYCVHLKSNLVRKETDRQLNILKRELAATQLLGVVGKNRKRGGDPVTRVLIAGDFNTNIDEHAYVSEGTIRSILESGFTDGFKGLDRKSRVTLPAKDQYADVTFDYVFHKGFSERAALEISACPEISDHRMVVVRLTP